VLLYDFLPIKGRKGEVEESKKEISVGTLQPPIENTIIIYKCFSKVLNISLLRTLCETFITLNEIEFS
jgi:hypothetical protein